MAGQTEANEPKEKRGLERPRYGCGHLRALYARARLRGKLFRRRACRHCGRRITTYEEVIGW